MRELIRYILKESTVNTDIINLIKDEDIFVAANFVGGMTNLKRLFKDDSEMNIMFENLTGTIFFYYYMGIGKYMKNMKFPLKYEIIGRKSNIHNTNHWPEINVFYNENKLTPEENDTFKSFIKYLIDETSYSDFDTKKFGNYKLFNVNYFTVKELNGENIDLIGGWDFPDTDIKNIHYKLYGSDQGLNEATVPPQVRRRNEYFDIFFIGKRKNINYCSFSHPDHLINYLLELTLEDLYHAWFYETVTYEEWEESIPYIENYIKDKYYDETVELWKNNCKGRRLYESDNKKQSLTELIDEYGLYDFIKMSGLNLNQVKLVLDEMGNPKELLKQFISEFVLEKGGSTGENYGSLFALQIPLSDTKYVEDILVHGDDSIAVEIWEFLLDEYGHREQRDQYLTTINNLTNDELLTIVAWMMESIKEGSWDY